MEVGPGRSSFLRGPAEDAVDDLVELPRRAEEEPALNGAAGHLHQGAGRDVAQVAGHRTLYGRGSSRPSLCVGGKWSSSTVADPRRMDGGGGWILVRPRAPGSRSWLAPSRQGRASCRTRAGPAWAELRRC